MLIYENKEALKNKRLTIYMLKNEQENEAKILKYMYNRVNSKNLSDLDLKGLLRFFINSKNYSQRNVIPQDLLQEASNRGIKLSNLLM